MASPMISRVLTTSKIDPKICFELFEGYFLKKDFRLPHGIQDIFNIIQKLEAHTGIYSLRIRLPIRFLKFFFIAISA